MYYWRMQMSSLKPECRADLICEEVGNELLVFDPVDDSVHSFSEEAVSVWNLCNGVNSVEAIASQTGLASSLVEEAIGGFSALGLFVSDNEEIEGFEISNYTADSEKSSRREAIGKAALAGAAATSAGALISSIKAPNAAAAQSGCQCGAILGLFCLPLVTNCCCETRTGRVETRSCSVSGFGGLGCTCGAWGVSNAGSVFSTVCNNDLVCFAQNLISISVPVIDFGPGPGCLAFPIRRTYATYGTCLPCV